MLSYTMDDETFTEMGEVDKLPHLWELMNLFCHLCAILRSYSSYPQQVENNIRIFHLLQSNYLKIYAMIKMIRYPLHYFKLRMHNNLNRLIRELSYSCKFYIDSIFQIRKKVKTKNLVTNLYNIRMCLWGIASCNISNLLNRNNKVRLDCYLLVRAYRWWRSINLSHFHSDVIMI